MMDYGSWEGSWVDLQSDSIVKLDFDPGSITDSSSVSDFDSET